VYPLLGFVALTVLAVIPTIGAIRYRASAEVAIVILAAVGVDVLLRWLRRRRSGGGSSSSGKRRVRSKRVHVDVNPGAGDWKLEF
jgi:hypothetical protein